MEYLAIPFSYSQMYAYISICPVEHVANSYI